MCGVKGGRIEDVAKRACTAFVWSGVNVGPANFVEDAVTSVTFRPRPRTPAALPAITRDFDYFQHYDPCAAFIAASLIAVGSLNQSAKRSNYFPS
jgi:hypothetical protein